ncbi:patatin-like phospholipase family protein [Robertkochia sediminum]|uniref:patatin-like phospholipase family protein n=1 Tax=Robertkochia sediminum TaxID=2785326 RepID=UPI0019340C4E|nr:patatin-like phospholipase family protein [Robertkochia sediminum]MBL7471461.1 patatin-like phospholipase family protein [Robertkochia sediminum]
MPETSFKLCLTMAGAVSAGAYTAGVMDELLGVLDRWEKAKARNLELGIDHPDYDHSIPMHRVELEVLSGASAGGITATLALKKILDSSHSTLENNSLLKDCWVSMADDETHYTLEKLLSTKDLNKEKNVRSLLNAYPIENLADRYLAPLKNLKKPSWLSEQAEVILTTTNLEGIDVNIDFNGAGTENGGHTITQHSSVFRFHAITDEKEPVPEPHRYATDLRLKEDAALLKAAALSTSAFPIGLPTRSVTLPHDPYLKYLPGKASESNLHIDIKNPHAHTPFPAIDGGLLNNEPYGWALKVLRENCAPACENNRYAVIMIDPLPSKPPSTKSVGSMGLWNTLTGMFRALRNEVMLNQEGLAEAISLKDRTRFLIAPRKGGGYPEKWNALGKVLASAPLGGFAGFIGKDLRAHDYELGRRNCRDFLRFHFTLPVETAKVRLDQLPVETALDRFCIVRRDKSAASVMHFPIIPDVRLKEARNQILLEGQVESKTYPVLPEFSMSDFIQQYQPLINKRLIALVRTLSGKWWLTLGFRLFLLRPLRKQLYKIITGEMKFFDQNQDAVAANNEVT